jgi:hypothetical protein
MKNPINKRQKLPPIIMKMRMGFEVEDFGSGFSTI